MNEPPVDLDAFPVERRLIDESTCIQCGYLLRGLDERGDCPECGTSIATSLDPNRLIHADPRRLRQMQIGFACVPLSQALLPVAFAIAESIATEFAYSTVLVGLFMWIFISLMLLSVRPHAAAVGFPTETLRQAVRGFSILSAGLLIGAVASLLLEWLVLFMLLGPAAVCAMLWLGHAVIEYAWRLALYSDDEGLSRKFREITPFYLAMSAFVVTAMLAALLAAVFDNVGDVAGIMWGIFMVVLFPIYLIGGPSALVVVIVLPLRLFQLSRALNRPMRAARSAGHR
ncbi:MAG: hypothetical protein IT430_02165 [Phycisphaerales bacterium]|nr:hypothetical protein [Phycisphaerales bacterium]